MALAPLVSRWQQAHADAPVPLLSMTMHGASHPMQAAPVAALSAHVPQAGHRADHPAMAGHAQHPAALATSAETAPAAMPADGHAGHGDACEYCMMASRLMPWLAVAVLLLALLPVIRPIVVFATIAPRTLHWPARSARGPPVHC